MSNTSKKMRSASRKPGINVYRQQVAAVNLAKGMVPEAAMVQADNSESYARHQGYKAVKRPCIQSIFTESCDRIMTKRHIQFDEIVEPIFDALKAKVIVKSTQLGDAQEVDLPDYPLRMSAADRLIELYGGTLEHKELPTQPQPSSINWQAFTLEERLQLHRDISARFSGSSRKDCRLS